MRILVLHSRYLSGHISGENRVVEEEATLLRDGGHEVTLLDPSPESMSVVSLAGRTLASTRIARDVRQRVRSEGFEIVHCHNLFPTLGSGVLRSASAAGAAVVLTLHNYRLMCVAGTFFRDGKICEDCVGRALLPGVVNACYRASRPQSAVLTAGVALARRPALLASVDRFVVLSRFMREKYVASGFPTDRMVLKDNFVSAQRRREGPGRYFLVLGRLTAEKGIADLVRAWSDSCGELWVVGDGPQRALVEQAAGQRSIRFLGAVSPAEVAGLIVQARAVLVPSRWYEGQPRVVLEAFAAGVPAIVSRVGGLAELVAAGEGSAVEPGELGAWSSVAARYLDDDVSIRAGDAAYRAWLERYSSAQALSRLESVYSEALAERARRSPKLRRDRSPLK
jgi:glycosyltransferase involved in cell wall biosynthesis